MIRLIPSFLLILAILCLVSCENQEEITVKFEQKKFVPKTTEEVNFKVKDFLSNTSFQPNATLRSEYEDKEVNEGFWTLEAAANYISNVNLDNALETTITYTLNIDNKVTDGIIMMDGPDMTTKFDDLQALIDDSTSDLSQVAKIVDAQLVSANDQQTVINFRVLFGANTTPPPPEDCEWASSTAMPEAGEIISGCISENLPQHHYYTDVRNYREGETSEFQSCFFEHFFNIALFRETYDPFPSEEMDQYYNEIMDFINCAITQLEPNDGSIHIHGPLTPIRVLLPSQGGMWNWLGTEFIFDELILGRVVAYD